MCKQRKPIAMFLALVAVLLLVAGCGGGETSASSSAADSSLATAESDGPLSKAEFIRQADAICERAQAKGYNDAKRYRRVHAKELSALSPVAAEEKLIHLIVLPSILSQARGLESLEAPEGQEKKIKSIVAEIRTAVKHGEKVPMSVESEFGYGKNPLHDVDIELREYGFEGCRNLR